MFLFVGAISPPRAGRLGQEDTISCESEAKVGKCMKNPNGLERVIFVGRNGFI